LTGLGEAIELVEAFGFGIEQVIGIRRDGTVVTWGYGGTNVAPNATNAAAAAVQGYAGCLVLRQDGTLVTWGDATLPPPSAMIRLRRLFKRALPTKHATIMPE